MLADIAFVNNCERVSRLVSRQKSSEPRRGALFVFWSPLRGARFTGDFDIFEAGLMRGAAAAIHNVDHSRAHLLQRLWRYIERSFRAHLVGGHDLVIERLHLLNEPCLIECSAVGDDAHGLRHLQRSNLNVALADRHVCDVAIEDFATVRRFHVFIIGNAAFYFAAQRNAAFGAEAQLQRPIDDRRRTGLYAGLIKPCVARFRERLHEI